MKKLELPPNPQDLLNLYSLRDQMRLKEELENNIESYIWNYVKSFFMTSDEILKYIPNEKHKEYFLDSVINVDLSSALKECDKDFKFADESTKIYYLVSHKEKTILPFGPIYDRDIGTDIIYLNGVKNREKVMYTGRTKLESYEKNRYDDLLDVVLYTSAKRYIPRINIGTQWEAGIFSTEFWKEVRLSFDMRTNSLKYSNIFTGRKMQGFDRFSDELKARRRIINGYY